MAERSRVNCGGCKSFNYDSKYKFCNECGWYEETEQKRLG